MIGVVNITHDADNFGKILHKVVRGPECKITRVSVPPESQGISPFATEADTLICFIYTFIF